MNEDVERLKGIKKGSGEDWDRIIEYAEGRKSEIEKFNARLGSR